MALLPCQRTCEPVTGPRLGLPFATSRTLLGGRFHFESDSEALLDLVETTYGLLPPQQFLSPVPEMRIELRLLPRRRERVADEPPPLKVREASGLLCGILDDCNYTVVVTARRRALIAVSEDMLDHAVHVRQELIEFAVFILAARCLRLVPLHAACFGRAGNGLLLLGNSGAGKSMLVLQGLLHGMELVSEDAVFVEPESLLATGVANYLHLRTDAPHLGDTGPVRNWIENARVIRRRSGVRKFEMDLRQGPGRLASDPLRLHAAVLISDEPAEDRERLLQPIDAAETAERLELDQAYASTQPGWRRFVQRFREMDVYRLRRWHQPDATIATLYRLL
ncbi:MAG TPA: serine kinase [Rhodanobacteraceae bacterium]|nr:serine kinase [Rhodanobacteraceae bacterium]